MILIRISQLEDKIKILFDSYHLYHLPQFEPLIDLLKDDDMFDIFHSTSSEIPKQEFELCASILKKKPGVFIPFIFMTVITTTLLFVFGFDPNKGRYKY